MNHHEVGNIALSLSIGFVVSMGIFSTLKVRLLNTRLLFLPTDILGVLAAGGLMAFSLGAT